MNPANSRGIDWKLLKIVTQRYAPELLQPHTDHHHKEKSIITLTKRNITHMFKKINLIVKPQQMSEQWYRVKI